MTLRKRISKNVYDLDTVRLVPHPALTIESSALARHYAATYALFRVSMAFLNLRLKSASLTVFSSARTCPWR